MNTTKPCFRHIKPIETIHTQGKGLNQLVFINPALHRAILSHTKPYQVYTKPFSMQKYVKLMLYDTKYYSCILSQTSCTKHNIVNLAKLDTYKVLPNHIKCISNSHRNYVCVHKGPDCEPTRGLKHYDHDHHHHLHRWTIKG